MPHHPDDNRYPHLPLIAEQPNPDRRRRPAPPSPPPSRGSRTDFADEVRERIDDMEEEMEQRSAPPAGIHPHLVFRVPLAPNASTQAVSEMLDRAGVNLVSIESDKAIIAFRDDVDLSNFREAVTWYEQGPQDGINPQTGRAYASTQWDVLEFIEAPQMRPWGREDRIGQRLGHEIGDEAQAIDNDGLYRVDVELWHRGTAELARAGLGEVRQLIQHEQQESESLSDEFVGPLLCLARVAVRGAKLMQLLDLDIVAEVDMPPQPFFDHRQALHVTGRELPTPPIPQAGGPCLCVVESGVTTNHPLLGNNVGNRSRPSAVTVTFPGPGPGPGLEPATTTSM